MTASARHDDVIKPDWPLVPGVRAFTSTRVVSGHSRPPYEAFNLGLRSGEDEAIVQFNRDLLMREFELPATPRWLRQVHGDRSLRLSAEVFAGEPEADAAFTTLPGVVLAILTADCLPVLLSADDGSEIAAIHAGWRGLSAGIVESSVRRMRTTPSRLAAWLGPAIGPASYEVGEEVRSAFVAHDPRAAEAFEVTRPGHWLCDLYTLARQRLRALGIERVDGGNFDTATDRRFYSYRRDGARSGRMATLIWRMV